MHTLWPSTESDVGNENDNLKHFHTNFKITQSLVIFHSS